MAYGYLDTLASDGVRAARKANGGHWDRFRADRPGNVLGEAERAFVAARDSFYLASVGESGWPYVQHRGGPPGFLRVLDDRLLGFADLPGNRQYITLGNMATEDRVSLILVDYPARARMKLLGHMHVHDLDDEPELRAALSLPDHCARAEHAFTIRLVAFDWNCPQHITPRFTAIEIEAAMAPLRERLSLLEAENARLRGVPPPSAEGSDTW